MKTIAEVRAQRYEPNPLYGERWLYAIQCGPGGAIKIGHTTDVRARLRHLQVSNPTKLIGIAAWWDWIDTERAIHELWKDACVSGEWFEPHLGLIAMVRDLGGDYDGWPK